MRPTAAVTVATAAAWLTRHARSRAVRTWRPSELPRRTAGDLHVRVAGSGSPVIVLLHGLMATGDSFGAGFDHLARDATLVVPDLLGFGRSLDEHRSSFAAADHVRALDEMLGELGLIDRPVVVGGHSMGAALAMRWAEHHRRQIRAVVGFGPAIYAHSAAVDDAIAGGGYISRAFVANTPLAAATCRLNCRHRNIGGAIAAAANPSVPIQISRRASLHTWQAYRGAVDDIVACTDWVAAAHHAREHGIAVELIWGSRDRIGDRGFASELPGVTMSIVENADHHLPLTHPEVCVERLARLASRVRRIVRGTRQW